MTKNKLRNILNKKLLIISNLPMQRFLTNTHSTSTTVQSKTKTVKINVSLAE